MTITLPFPPSLNTYWRHITRGRAAGRVLISKKGREYRAEVIRILGKQAPHTGRLGVSIFAYPPDDRRRDLDNIPKAILDALTHAQVMEDDSQIDTLQIFRRTTMAGGFVSVIIEQL